MQNWRLSPFRGMTGFFCGLTEISFCGTNFQVNKDYQINPNLPDVQDRWLSPNISLHVYEWSEWIDEKALPDYLLVDYIRVYQTNE